MATVYLANDRNLGRQVALKVLHAELATAVGVERFLREIGTAAGLNHPLILALHDSGEAGDLPFYTMPYVEGEETLRRRLNRERQPSIEDAVAVTCDVAEALAYAHSRGVVHRDIKPENILFSAGRAVVADFGIARALTVARIEPLTGIGAMIGTPAYMSPEQVAGDAALDGRSDQYSLACVLYEMLAGRPPFDGPTVQAVLARLSIELPAPIRTARPSVPIAMEAAVLKALAKVPADRFATIAQFADALRAWDDAPAVAADAESIAVLPFANLSADPGFEYLSDGIAEDIINALAQLPGLRVAARTSSFAFRARAVELAEVGAKLKVAMVLEGSVRKAGNRLRVTAQLVKVGDGDHLWSERYDRDMTDIFAIQDEIAKAIAERLKVTLDGGGGAAAGHRAESALRHRATLALLLSRLHRGPVRGGDRAWPARRGARPAVPVAQHAARHEPDGGGPAGGSDRAARAGRRARAHDVPTAHPPGSALQRAGTERRGDSLGRGGGRHVRSPSLDTVRAGGALQLRREGGRGGSDSRRADRAGAPRVRAIHHARDLECRPRAPRRSLRAAGARVRRP